MVGCQEVEKKVPSFCRQSEERGKLKIKNKEKYDAAELSGWR
jgi:hypothetical protein